MTAKDGITRYWQVIVVCAGIVMAWGNITYEVSALKVAMADEKTESKEQDDKQVELDKAIVKIETTQSAMKEDIDDIKTEQQEQSVKLDKIIEKLSEQ